MRIVLKATLKEVFFLADGRFMGTGVDDIKTILSFVVNRPIMPGEIPQIMAVLERTNPEWFHNVKMAIDSIKVDHQTNNFKYLMKILDHHYSNIEVDIEQIN